MINFKYVRWKNFLSTGNQFTEIKLDKEPTTLIIGENGAGKSTILKIIMGLIEPDNGSVYIDEKPSNDYLLDCSYLSPIC